MGTKNAPATKSQQPANAQSTTSEAVDFSVRDYIKHAKKLAKAKSTLESIPGMKDAVEKVSAQIAATRAALHKAVDQLIDKALSED